GSWHWTRGPTTADDFLTKPFRAGELVARLNAILKHANRSDRRPRIHLDGLNFDLPARIVYRDTSAQLERLRVLAHNRGRMLTHMGAGAASSRHSTPPVANDPAISYLEPTP